MSRLPALLCMAVMVVVCQADYSNSYYAANHCKLPPPGVMKMGLGVDITELELCPMQTIGNSGFKSPVVKMKCVRPWKTDETEYDVPESVWADTTTPGGLAYSSTRVYSGSYSLRQSLREQVGGSGSIFRFAFSASKSFSSMQQLMLSKRMVYSEIQAVDATKRVDLKPNWALRLDPMARDYLKKYVGNKDIYHNYEGYKGFINMFGTHYFSVANFGGGVRVRYQTDSTYFSNRTTEEVRKNAYLSFSRLISMHGAKSRTKTEAESAFLASTTEIVSYFGGNVNFLAYDGVQKWQPTVSNDPWITSGILEPISELIPDRKQKENMRVAAFVHVLLRFLEELWRMYYAQEDNLADAAAIKGVLTELDVANPWELVEKVAAIEEVAVKLNIF